MRVVQVYKDFEPPVFGGIEHTLRLLSEGLAEKPGLEVTVVCSSHRPRTVIETIGRVQVVRVATFGRVARTPLSPSVAGWIKRLSPDLLHFHFPNPAGEMACLLARPACPVVVTYHADIVRQRSLLMLYQFPLKQFLRRADRILVTTPATLKSNRFLDPHLDRCRVVPSGISETRMAETPRSIEVTRALRAAHTGPIFLFVGRMRPYKGLLVLIEAMTGVAGTLLVVGTGEMEAQVRAKIRKEGLGDRVVLAGDVPDRDLPGYYRAADVFVLPSIHRSEAFGLCMLEAMMCGLPVVSTRLGTGTSYVNLDGVTGLEVSPGSPLELAQAMARLTEDQITARRMATEGLRRAWEFGASTMVERTWDVYSELLGLQDQGVSVAQ